MDGPPRRRSRTRPKYVSGRIWQDIWIQVGFLVVRGYLPHFSSGLARQRFVDAVVANPQGRIGRRYYAALAAMEHDQQWMNDGE